MKGGLFQCGEARLFHTQTQKLYIIGVLSPQKPPLSFSEKPYKPNIFSKKNALSPLFL